MKEGMMVKPSRSRIHPALTYGKEYEVVSVLEKSIQVQNDNGDCHFYDKTHFVEVRNELPTNVSSKWKFAAMDKRNTRWYVFVKEPKIGPDYWIGSGNGRIGSIFDNLPTDIPWKESLHERQPDGSWKQVVCLPDLKVDDIVEIRALSTWFPRHFSHFNGNLVAVFSDGRSSKTAVPEDTIDLKEEYWRLPK